MDWMELIGAELKSQAATRGLKSKDVAERMDRTVQWVNSLNRGKGRRIDAYQDYAKVIGVETGELFELVSRRAKIRQAIKEVEA